MKLPLRHLSVRVPWHDGGWTGRVCKNPRDNASCMFLPRIQTKDVEFEEANANEYLHELDMMKLPPCVAEKVSFMSPHDIFKVVSHPYSENEGNAQFYGHYKPTKLRYPGYSFSVIPYRWMLKTPKTNQSEIATELGLNYESQKEPDLNFENSWVQQIENQKEMLDTFISAIQEEKSLIFIYAKNIPQIETGGRVLIGVGRVKKIGKITEYDYGKTNPPFRSVLWERPIFHSIRNGFADGFILPYPEFLEMALNDDSINPYEYVSFAPNIAEFSYGSEHVNHDTAIDSLIVLRDSLLKFSKLLDKNYSTQIDWINNEISRLWNMRGAFPGLGSVLSAMGIPEGNLIAWELERIINKKDGDMATTNPWDYVDRILKGDKTILPNQLTKQIGGTMLQVWVNMSVQKKEYLQLLSRLQINNDQALIFYKKEEFSEYLKNPYLFFEQSRLGNNGIAFNTIDKALFPSEKINESFPVPEPSVASERVDQRRVRALGVDILESVASAGDTLLSEDQFITRFDEAKIEPTCPVNRDILTAVDPFLGTEIKIIPEEIVVDTESGIQKKYPKFYKLQRLQEFKEIIYRYIERRVNKGKRHDISIDWREVIEAVFGPIDNKLPEWFKQKEEVARKEKSAALNEIARSRFSVLIGPAGTGKTTLLNLFSEQPQIKNTKILRLAPTGKARVKLGFDAKTIAQFLLEWERYDPLTGRYFINPKAEHYSEAKTVIVDEASMMTEDQLAALLDAVIGADRFILVGDHRQLPPIGSGRPFVDIINYLVPETFPPNNPKVSKGYAELETIFRQIDKKDIGKTEEDRPDVRLSKWFSNSIVRKTGEDIFKEIESTGMSWKNLKFIPWYSVNELEQLLRQELQKELNLKSMDDQIGFDKSLGAVENNGFTYFNIEAGKDAENWQILSPMNNHGFGTKEINRMIHKNFKTKMIDLATNPGTFPNGNRKKRKVAKPRGEDQIVYGDKVINLRNVRWGGKYDTVYPDPPKDPKITPLRYIANGEIGLVTGVFSKNWNGEHPTQITFSSQPGYSYVMKGRHFKEDGDVVVELAYAITTHKSQGSGFKKVFFILPNPCPILSRELLYTALTRQEQKIIVFHQGDFKDFHKYCSDEYSDTGRRITDLFFKPDLRQIEKKYYDNKYVQISAKGDFMISKSEVIIADHLFYNDVAYAYDNATTDRTGITIHPDFTIEDAETGTIYYWEHLGMLTMDDYRGKWQRKQEWYARNNVIPYSEAPPEHDKLLITTKDKPDGGIDSSEILRIIKKVIKGNIDMI